MVTRPPRYLLPLLALAAAVGCGEDSPSPTQPLLDPPSSVGAAAVQPLVFTLLSAGFFKACAVAEDSRGYCWGNEQDRPLEIPGGLRFRQVSVGSGHTCGLTTDSRAYCWGDNFFGELGDGTITFRRDPVPVLGGLKFRIVRGGGNFSCGITLSDETYCWGRNEAGELGDSSAFKARRRPVLVAGGHTFRQVVPGSGHTCGVTTGNKAFCWGYGPNGQIGDGKTFQRRWPRAVAGGLSFSSIAAGSNQSCGITLDARAYCWGLNTDGELGDGTTTTRLMPVAVAGGRHYRLISPGTGHTCATTTDDRAFCWGDNTSGALGEGTTTSRLRPVAVAGGIAFNGVSAGLTTSPWAFTCGRTPANRVYCWGSNFESQLGDGTTLDRLTPSPVAPPE